MTQGPQAGKGAAAWVCSGVGPEQPSQGDWPLQPGTPSRPRQWETAPLWRPQTGLLPAQLRSRQTWLPSSALTSCMTLDKLFKFVSSLSLFHLSEKDKASFTRSGSNETVYVV